LMKPVFFVANQAQISCLIHKLKQWVWQMCLFATILGAEHHFQEKKWCQLHWHPIQNKSVQSLASVVLLGYEIMHDTSTVLFLHFTFDWVVVACQIQQNLMKPLWSKFTEKT
jgi:hypothetical protein